MARPDALAGRRILLVEDDFFVADDMAATFAAAGAEVVGPVPTVPEALALIEGADARGAGGLDGVVLDINLRGEMAYPLADALMARGVPFVFATGYDRGGIPARYAGVVLCEKPFDVDQVAHAMWG